MKINTKTYLGLLLSFAFALSCGSKRSKHSERTGVSAADGAAATADAESDSDEITVRAPEGAAALQTYVGVRNFAEIYGTFATLTGIPANDQNLRDVYDEVQFSLPSNSNDVRAFSGPHQAAILKLASEFCLRMMNENLDFLVMPGTSNPIPRDANGLQINPTAKRAMGRAFAERFWLAAPGMVDYTVAETESEKLIDGLILAAQEARDSPDIADFSLDQNNLVFAVCTAVLASFPTIER